MSVAFNTQIERLPWGGSPLPAEPASIWRGNASLPSDASGGTNTITFRLSLVGAPISGFVYSLEQVSIRVDSSAADIPALIVANLGWIPAELGGAAQFDARWHITLLHDAGVLIASMTPEQTDGMRGTLLGGPIPQATLDGRVRVTIPNTDTETVNVFVMGYVWEQLAVSRQGGPKRPANGLFVG